VAVTITVSQGAFARRKPHHSPDPCGVIRNRPWTLSTIQEKPLYRHLLTLRIHPSHTAQREEPPEIRHGEPGASITAGTKSLTGPKGALLWPRSLAVAGKTRSTGRRTGASRCRSATARYGPPSGAHQLAAPGPPRGTKATPRSLDRTRRCPPHGYGRRPRAGQPGSGALLRRLVRRSRTV